MKTWNGKKSTLVNFKFLPFKDNDLNINSQHLLLWLKVQVIDCRSV
ncbi:hypothetical protein SAMN05444362_10519 [Dysgonomonas macrotermitis]|uniref:Uncharacterized protein n=1 Tax=Dysgonomonas macrotermitis TaxID=1346286 RepID=A0A1M5ADT6_9BACT|nr:hypothetical protein SAMN05444362_10519 [Dysgonomonas macrotermitis]